MKSSCQFAQEKKKKKRQKSHWFLQWTPTTPTSAWRATQQGASNPRFSGMSGDSSLMYELNRPVTVLIPRAGQEVLYLKQEKISIVGWVDYNVGEKPARTLGSMGCGLHFTSVQSSGVPQRLLLSLILLIVFNNSLSNGREHTFSKFMDSTKLGGTFNMLKGKGALKRYLMTLAARAAIC